MAEVRNRFPRSGEVLLKRARRLDVLPVELSVKEIREHLVSNLSAVAAARKFVDVLTDKG